VSVAHGECLNAQLWRVERRRSDRGGEDLFGGERGLERDAIRVDRRGLWLRAGRKCTKRRRRTSEQQAPSAQRGSWWHGGQHSTRSASGGTGIE
jgi:hypothetical protein